MVQIKPLCENLQKVAIEELGEVPARLTEDLQALKLWIHQQPHLKARTHDQFLVQFLRGSKYSLERAKDKLDSFYTLKTKYPEMFSATDIDATKFRDFCNLGCLLPLPTPLNGCGPRIMTYRFNYSVKEFNVEEVVLHSASIHEILMQTDPYACIYGVIYVLDMATITTNHILQMTPSVLKKSIAFIEKSLPLRIKALCYINVGAVAEHFCKLIMPLISKKLRERVFICGKDMDNLLEYLPLKYLPHDYGGDNGLLEQICADYATVWQSHKEYFRQNSEYGSDERLRVGKPIDFEGIFGLGGSFRKIDVD